MELEEGSVQLPPEGEIILPNGDKVTNSSDPDNGGESVTVNDDNSVRVPAGSEATLGEGDDAIKVSVPKSSDGEPDSLPAEVKPNKDGTGYEVKAEPGNDVTIGDETYRTGDYDTSFGVKPGDGENGEPEIIVTDGAVELKPGQSITDSNGIKYTNKGDNPIKLSMTDGENTEATLSEGDKFEYLAPGEEEPKEFENPGSSEADFSISKGGEDVSLSSDMDIPKGKAVDVDFLGQKVTITVPESNSGDISIDPVEGTVTIGKAGDKVIIDGKEYIASEDGTVIKPGEKGVELKEGGVKLDPNDSIISGGTKISNTGSGETTVENIDGQTKVTVPQNGGFSMVDPASGESVFIKNSGSESKDYRLDDDGSLILPSNSETTYTQKKDGNQKNVTIGSIGDDEVKLRPTEDGAEITVPKNNKILIDGVEYPNVSEEDDLVISTDFKTGKPVLVSGETSVPAGKDIALSGGTTIKNENGNNIVDAEGNVKLPAEGDKVTVDFGGNKNSYTSAGSDTELVLDSEKGIPTLTKGSVKLDKNSAVDVVYDKIIHHGEGEGEYKDADYTEDLKATIKSTGDNPPTVNDDGTISIPKNGAVDIDSEIKSEDPEQAGKKAHNSVAVPQNAQNETVSVKPNTDGSADITLENSDDSVKVNGIEYTTTEDDTIINITENGSTLTKGAVELDGGKTPKEGINVNNVSVTNAGLNGSTASVKKNEDGSTSLEVSPNGAFELAVIGQPENGVTIKNTSDSDGEYVVKPDGSVDVSGDSIVNFKTSSGNKTITVLSDSDEESEETGPNKVNVKPTEDGIRLTAPQGSGFDMNGVKYTNSAEDDDDLVITVGSDGVPTLNEGKTTFTDGGKLQLKENGPVITGKGGDIVADDLGNVSVPGDAVLEVQTQDGKKSSYTATEDDTQIHFDLSNPQTSVPEIKSGSVALGKGSSIKAGGNTFTSTGVNSPIVNIPEQSDPENAGISSTVDLVPNSAVTIERTVTGAGGTPSTLKTNVGIPAGSDGLKLVSNSDGIVSMIVER